MRTSLIVVPYDSGHRDRRMGAGPLRVVEGGLPARLREAGHEVSVEVVELPAGAWPSEISGAFELARGVALRVAEARAGGRFPLVLSGNCGPAAHGSVAGLSANGPKPAVLWFDAHGDFNTPETTVGGFLDGMSLATLTGRCWAELTRSIPGFAAVPEAHVGLIGTRDLDPLEARLLSSSEVRRVAANRVREDLPGLVADLATRADLAYLHLDLDVLDPSEGRVNRYSVAGGLSVDDLLGAIGAIGSRIPVSAAALTEYAPEEDPAGRILDATIRVALSLLSVAK